MDNGSGVGVLDKAALVLTALESGPATLAGNARTSERHSESAVRSKTSSAHRAREWPSTITNTHRLRSPPSTGIRPT